MARVVDDAPAVRPGHRGGGGLEARRLAYAACHHEVCELAVWLFNVREEKPVANAMFRWLLAEAEIVGDSASADVNRKNVACGV